MAQKILSQADKRRDLNLEDQLGRLWLAAIEKETFEPTGLISAAGWTDPLRTPTQYIKIPRDKYNNPQVSRCEIAYLQWANDQRNATREWKTRLWNIGRETQKNAFDPKTAEQDEYLLHLVGPKPWPAPEIILEAFANKTKRAKMLLGFKELDRDTRMLLGYVELEDLEAIMGEKLTAQQQAMVDMDAERFTGSPDSPAAQRAGQALAAPSRPGFSTASYKEFSEACLKRGIPMKKIGGLWNDLKKIGVTADQEA